MKIVNLSFFIAFVLMISIGCGKDEPVHHVIVGEWTMTETHCNDGVILHDVLGQEEIQTFSYHGTEYNATTTFTENPNQFFSSGYYKYEYTTTYLGDTETTILQSDAILGTGQWSIEDDTLFQTQAGNMKEFVILELNESKMRLRLDLNTTEGGLPTTGTVFLNFEKN
ncbi:MAG: lipocalin family protein [Saprospiraceae bacterium]